MTLTCDPANRLRFSSTLTGRTTYAYDANGNQRRELKPTGGITTFSWTAENQQRSVELPTGEIVTSTWCPVTRAGDEFRVEQDHDGIVTRYLWDRHNIIQERDDVGGLDAEFTYLPQEYGNLLSQRRDSVTSLYHFDALGSALALTDSSQVVTDTAFYKPFGEPWVTTGTTTNPYNWIGQLGYYQDPVTGQLILRRRPYEVGQSRFLTEDPAEFDSNLYRYSFNNPVNVVDPSGLGAFSVPSGTDSELLEISWTVFMAGYLWGSTTTTPIGNLNLRTNLVCRSMDLPGGAWGVWCVTRDELGRLPEDEGDEILDAWTAADWDVWFQINGHCDYFDEGDDSRRQIQMKKDWGEWGLLMPELPCGDEKFTCPRGTRALSKQDRDTLVRAAESFNQVAMDAASSFGPLAAIRDVISTLTGKDPVTNEDLALYVRVLNAIFAIVTAGVLSLSALKLLRRLLPALKVRIRELANCLAGAARSKYSELDEILVHPTKAYLARWMS